jgi:hypothetical protein
MRTNCLLFEELDGPAVSALRRAIGEVKQRWSVMRWVNFRASEGTLSLWISLTPINPHWARVVDYGPFSLSVIHKACAPAVETCIG